MNLLDLVLDDQTLQTIRAISINNKVRKYYGKKFIRQTSPSTGRGAQKRHVAGKEGFDNSRIS